MGDACRDWLNAARDDIATIELLLNQPALSNVAAFHAQQAVEKILKALWEYKAIPMGKTHNLERLYAGVITDLPDLDSELLITLNELYIESRYPGDFGLLPDGKPSVDEVRNFYDFALALYAEVDHIVSS